MAGSGFLRLLSRVHSWVYDTTPAGADIGRDWLRGPVEEIDGDLGLRIPLADGGERLGTFAHGWGVVTGDVLVIPVHRWMAEKLELHAGDFVEVGVLEEKLCLRKAE